ncbi:hypothetical protein CHKEEEPN_1502 [Methylorubrum podarium]|nr:hypothetical protein CHKEEEPN_1502 [Methylorubrum podarium]
MIAAVTRVFALAVRLPSVRISALSPRVIVASRPAPFRPESEAVAPAPESAPAVFRTTLSETLTSLSAESVTLP